MGGAGAGGNDNSGFTGSRRPMSRTAMSFIFKWLPGLLALGLSACAVVMPPEGA